MRIDVNGGHTPAAPGAGLYLDELREDRGMKEAVKAELSRRGHTVTDSTSPDGLGQSADLAHQVAAVNANGAELALSFHFNAASPTSAPRGTEAYYYGGDERGRAVAAAVSASLAAAMGLPDRGAKDGSHLYYVARTAPTAVLVEVCFVDSSADAAAYNACSWKALADAVCDAVERAMGVQSGGRGWVEQGGRWWYERDDGTYPADEWERVGGEWFLFDAEGWMLTGWQERGGLWYWMDETGAMKTGWQYVGGEWYYLNPAGDMATGWKEVGGRWYLLADTGEMLTGFRDAGGSRYFLDASGAMATGWFFEGGDWYLADESGALLSGVVEDGGGLYSLRTEKDARFGALEVGWIERGGRRMFAREGGALARSTCLEVGGRWYAFRADCSLADPVRSGEGGAIDLG